MSLPELFSHFAKAIAGLVVAWTMFQNYIPYNLHGYIDKYSWKMVSLISPYISIIFDEYAGEDLSRSEVYTAIQNYLSANTSMRAKRLKADVVKHGKSVLLTMDHQEEIFDDFNGIKVWWTCIQNDPKTNSFSFYPRLNEKKYFKLTCHRRFRDIIIKSYIEHVIKKGKAISVQNRQRKLYTNNPSKDWYGWRRTTWSHVEFEHPATFESLAMSRKMKEEIRNDLIKFSQGKNYYAKIGKAWKRGYLLYGRPGTGKSTMIAAMANLLNYDVYDLELTTVKDNSELKKLLIDTANKSIIVIEDIDCSLNLTGQRKPKKKDDDDETDHPVSKKKKEEEEEKNETSKVTLSGLLNFIDGIWSACGSERIILFTTNYVEKLDPALIRRGRMDKHIEMSYCSFEAFKVLAMNYLDVESHELFAKIEDLLGEVSMTPADVAENLMPKSTHENEETCLKNLLAALEEAKEKETKKKAQEEEEKLLKAQEQEKEKAAKEDEGKNHAKETQENGFAYEI